MNNIYNFKINDVETFIKVISELQVKYPPLSSYSIFDNFVFRGVPDCDYELIPSLYRKCGFSEDDSNIYYIESKENINDYILKIPANNLEFENYILDDFKREAFPYFEDATSLNAIALMERAQHYSVPTRLLDWTTNPLVALYFACAECPQQDGIVWMINKFKYSKYLNSNSKINWTKKDIDDIAELLLSDDEKIEKPALPILFMPYYFDLRMASQQSCFMMWGTESKSLEDFIDENNYMQIDNNKLDSNGKIKQEVKRDDDKFIAPIFINKEKKLLILDKLRMLGINEKTIFPGLDGAGRLIKEKYKSTYIFANKNDLINIYNNSKENHGKDGNEN